MSKQTDKNKHPVDVREIEPAVKEIREIPREESVDEESFETLENELRMNSSVEVDEFSRRAARASAPVRQLDERVPLPPQPERTNEEWRSFYDTRNKASVEERSYDMRPTRGNGTGNPTLVRNADVPILRQESLLPQSSSSSILHDDKDDDKKYTIEKQQARARERERYWV